MTAEPPEIAFEEVPRRKLSETVAERILDTVQEQQPGTRLPPERELSASLGVGRSTVREALHGLAAIGVVEIRHGQGVFVAEAPSMPADAGGDAPELTTLIEARPAVEPALAALAAKRATPAQLDEIAALLAAHRREIEAASAPKIPGSQFHLLVASAAGNRVLASVVRPLFRIMLESGPQLYELQDDYLGWELEEHTRIFNAIRDRDAESAETLMREHVEAMTEIYERWLETKAPSG